MAESSDRDGTTIGARIGRMLQRAEGEQVPMKSIVAAVLTVAACTSSASCSTAFATSSS